MKLKTALAATLLAGWAALSFAQGAGTDAAGNAKPQAASQTAAADSTAAQLRHSHVKEKLGTAPKQAKAPDAKDVEVASRRHDHQRDMK